MFTSTKKYRYGNAKAHFAEQLATSLAANSPAAPAMQVHARVAHRQPTYVFRTYREILPTLNKEEFLEYEN